MHVPPGASQIPQQLKSSWSMEEFLPFFVTLSAAFSWSSTTGVVTHGEEWGVTLGTSTAAAAPQLDDSSHKGTR